MDTSAVQKAVSLALSGKWEEAVRVNLDILENNPKDTDALCRLARAYAEIGKLSEARKATDKVLEIDSANRIALNFAEKLKLAKKYTLSPSVTCNESFLEEPGKTKLVKLMNPGKTENFINLDPGEEVALVPYSHKVAITTSDKKYIGRLPDDISARLKYLIREGNKYQVLIKSIKHKEIIVFIREIEKGPKVGGISSFTSEKIDYVSFTPPELVHSDIPDTGTVEEAHED